MSQRFKVNGDLADNNLKNALILEQAEKKRQFCFVVRAGGAGSICGICQAGQLYYASGSARQLELPQQSKAELPLSFACDETLRGSRKGAFHLVLAGHTYNKLGFKRLSLKSCC